MSDDRWRKIKEIFAGAAGRSGADREAYLAHACGGDADLRSLVESLLTGEFSDSPLAARVGGHSSNIQGLLIKATENSF